MAYNKDLAERIRAALAGFPTREVAMFGGLSFLVNEKITVSASASGDLLVRCDPARVDDLLAEKGAQWAEMRGRRMKKGWLRIDAAGFQASKDLAFWLATAVEYNENTTRKGSSSYMHPSIKPTKADLLASADRTISDVIGPHLRVLFVGINPGLYSGWTGHHFARPGNRFWPTLYAAGFTPRLFHPSEERKLLDYGCGVTNFVNRATATAAELTPEELVAGGARLEQTVAIYHPQSVAVLGITAYRTAFGRPKARLGRQSEPISGAPVWVLPNPSGLNAHYTPASLAEVFREFRAELDALSP